MLSNKQIQIKCNHELHKTFTLRKQKKEMPMHTRTHTHTQTHTHTHTHLSCHTVHCINKDKCDGSAQQPLVSITQLVCPFPSIHVHDGHQLAGVLILHLPPLLFESPGRVNTNEPVSRIKFHFNSFVRCKLKMVGERNG